jgi:predicted RNase H-like HicB family nuclease
MPGARRTQRSEGPIGWLSCSDAPSMTYCRRRPMTLTIEFERETDGRWIAGVPELPGVLVYADTQDKAAQLARALAFRVLADQIEAGEVGAVDVAHVSFAA